MHKFLSPICLIAFLSTAIALLPLTANEQDSLYKIEETALKGTTPDDFLDSYNQSIDIAKSIPGGASVLSLEDDFIGNVVTTGDLFRYEPGVYAQAGAVPLDARLSIRGSGATRRFGNRGLTLLIDGIPANNVDGSFYTRAYDPFATEYIEVFRGANGLPYGNTQIGGAINFVQKTGITSPGTEAIVEYGSFETVRAHISQGYHKDKQDFYVSASRSESNGFRRNQNWLQYHVTANYGYQWTDNVVTRAYVIYSDSDADLASGLSKEEALNNPKSARNAGTEDRDLSTFRVSQKTGVDLDHTQIEFFSYFQILDFDHLTRSNFPQNFIDYDTDEFGLGARSATEFELGNLEHIFRSSLLYNFGDNEIGGFRNEFGPTPQLLTNDHTDSSENFQIYLENETFITEKFSILYGLGWQYSQRERELHSGHQNIASNTRSEFDVDYDGYTPRLGLIYKFENDWTLFANYSHAFESPALSESEDLLDDQTAQTFELGTRFDQPRYYGELVYYHSSIEDDFVDFETNGGGFVSENIDTERQGVEAALTIALLPDISEEAPFRLYLDNIYQWNDFTFDGGELDGNQLPGISENIWTARLRLEDSKKIWRIALSLERVASGLEVNNANDIESSDPFTLINISADWKITENILIYGGIDNLFDEDYINTVTINPFNTNSAYSPGNGISAYLGVKVNF